MVNLAEKGKSAYLLKSGSRQMRKRSEMEEVKEEEKQLSKDK